MSMRDMQREVDEWMQGLKIGYWQPLEIFARLSEETGELARELNIRYGAKKRKSSEVENSLEDEMGDILLRCVAWQIRWIWISTRASNMPSTNATAATRICMRRNSHERTGLLTLAEDTGLEVDALGGAPGIKTARYAPGTDTDRYQKLLQDLSNVPDTERGAQFRTVAALYDPTNDKIRLTKGTCRGMLLREPRGRKSFGYSPVFYLPEHGKTIAEMEMDELNAISHRGQAIKAAREMLLREFV